MSLQAGLPSLAADDAPDDLSNAYPTSGSGVNVKKKIVDEIMRQ